MVIKVAVAGPRGKMGREAVGTIIKNEDFLLVGLLDSKKTEATLGDNIPIYTSLTELIEETAPDVLVDLTVPSAVYEHIITALEYGVRPVVGTTGFSEVQLDNIRNLVEEKQVGCIIAPNFSIGAVLMMKFAQTAAKYLPDVEIIELHHDEKVDAPSGTAIKTAQMIQNTREASVQGHPEEEEILKGARGANFDGMRIHSVRLPGLIAHQQVLLGGDGQLLTLRHDSFNRSSFMSGVVISIKEVMNQSKLVYGLEEIIL
ncbi:4-hydroxy-tetrahydrodipicolinate reductase [Psychrobacillus sp. FSL K6-2684]|uniref:4-hydroxy-tetrahydrodipicolinate reductase n=1 Tax=unclassified Psychrobacillus TaxID=2636677 RepID=UPI0011A13685|nr:4-hydroxy-tetrahydrodipicolinate reductase [Psychrobacillus sp. AK 1817]QEY19845.1 4-hydroxy-tetrahydrodipicolinate reductase [Psychrobacillus sp. AK 1817]